MDEIIYKLPKGIELSQHLREKAIAYFRVMLSGHYYYVPITKQMKKRFGMKQHKGKILYSSFSTIKFEDMLQIIIDSVYLQVRDVVCAGIEQSLDQELREGFSQLFDKYLHKRVMGEMVKRLPAPKGKNDSTR
jgi:hypothetical protein